MTVEQTSKNLIKINNVNQASKLKTLDVIKLDFGKYSIIHQVMIIENEFFI